MDIGRKILPFGKNLISSNINTSTDGSSVTTFTFDSPVFVKADTEYCVTLYSHSQIIKFDSRMGRMILVTQELYLSNLMLEFYSSLVTI